MIMNPAEIEKLGINSTGTIHYNLSYDELIDHELKNGECEQANNGAMMVDTGIFTGRSPKDKYFVNQDPSNKYIAWGNVNQPTTKEVFDDLFQNVTGQLSGKDLYVMDLFTGASEASKRNVRFVSEIAWQAHFVKNMFIRPLKKELEGFSPDFTVLNACKTVNENYEDQNLHSEVFVIFNIEENIAIIGGTWYGGEMKKGIFSMKCKNYIFSIFYYEFITIIYWFITLKFYG